MQLRRVSIGRSGPSWVGPDEPGRFRGLWLGVSSVVLLVAASVLARISGPTGIGAIAGATQVLLAPLVVGSAIRRGRAWGFGGEFAFRLVLGNATLLATAAALSWLGWFSVERVAAAVVVAGVVVLVTGRDVWRTAMFATLPRGAAQGGRVLGLVVAVIVAVLAVVYWRSASPVPFQPIWDQLLHLRPIHTMIGEGVFSLELSDYTSAFQVNPYLPGLHLRVALVSVLSGVEPLYVFWGGPFVLLSLTVAATYDICWRLWRSPFAALLGSALVPFLFVFTKQTAPGIHMLPASEVVMLAPFVVGTVLEPVSRSRGWRPLVLTALTLPMHLLVGTLLLGVAAVGILGDHLLRTRFRRWMVSVVATSAGLGYLFADVLIERVPAGLVVDPTGTYGSLTPSADLQARLELVAEGALNPWLTGGALIALGVLIHDRRVQGRWCGVVAVAVPAIAFLVPVIGLERYHAFVYLLIAVALSGAVSRMAAIRVDVIDVRDESALKVGVITLAIVLYLLALPTVWRPLVGFASRQLTDTDYRTLASSFTPGELKEFSAIGDWMPGNALVISDPISQSMAEGFGGIDTQGGPYLPAWLRGELIEALTAENPDEARDAFRSIESRLSDYAIYLVLSGRTYRWAYRDGDPWDFEFRPRDIRSFPKPPVPESKETLIGRIVSTGCVQALRDQGEIVFIRLDCGG